MKKITKIIIGASAVMVATAVTAAVCINKVRTGSVVIPGGFTVTAHTGCEGTADNSLDSITAGADCGAEIVEFDLNFTAEGLPVLAHDEPGEDCVTLQEAFYCVSQYDSLKVNVDCKSMTNLKAVLETAKQYGIENRIFYTGVEREEVETVRADTPTVSYYLNTEIASSKKNDESYIRALAAETKELGAVGININYRDVSGKMVEIFHEEGLLVSVWTVNSELAMHRILALGCDNITTRYPSTLRKVINKKV